MVNHPNRSKKRFTVRTDVPPSLKNHGIVAYVHDASHPDDARDGASVCWCMNLFEAEAIRDCLNIQMAARA